MSDPIREHAREILRLAEELGNRIESFNELGGQVNLTVWHNGGTEGETLHQLNGELELELLKIEEVKPWLDDTSKIVVSKDDETKDEQS